jgi:hypothetical protein
MELLLGIIIVLLLVLLFLNFSNGHHGWSKRFVPNAIKVMVSPTTPAVAVATPASTTGSGVAATASTPPAAAAAAVQEAMSNSKFTKAWY